MVRLFALALPLVASAVMFAAPAAAECQDGMASVEYALAIATGEAPASTYDSSSCRGACYDRCCSDSFCRGEGEMECLVPCLQGCGGAD